MYQTIVEKLPPVRGVINGAMVLRDTSILNMSVDDLITVLRPKVDGSIYLDRLFHDVDLDFFVLVSSINCVIGNLGQAHLRPSAGSAAFARRLSMEEQSSARDIWSVSLAGLLT